MIRAGGGRGEPCVGIGVVAACRRAETQREGGVRRCRRPACMTAPQSAGQARVRSPRNMRRTARDRDADAVALRRRRTGKLASVRFRGDRRGRRYGHPILLPLAGGRCPAGADEGAFHAPIGASRNLPPRGPAPQAEDERHPPPCQGRTPPVKRARTPAPRWCRRSRSCWTSPCPASPRGSRARSGSPRRAGRVRRCAPSRR